MADFAITQQGRFLSTGTNKTLQIRSGVDWIRVYNLTAIEQSTDDLPTEFYFQNGMTPGTGLAWIKLGSEPLDPITQTVLVAPNGFTVVDSSGNPLSTAVAVTSSTNATQPIYLTGSTAGLVDGSIVRLTGTTGQLDVAGMDWAVTDVDPTHFTLAAVLANVPGGTASAGFWRIIKFDPLFYPRHRYIVDIEEDGDDASQAIITLSVPSGYKVGQEVRIINRSPQVFGMPEINGLIGIITEVDDDLDALFIRVNIDIRPFTAFRFPTAAQAAAGAYGSKAMVVPVGIDITTAVNAGQDQLSDATINQGYIGVVLAGGAGAGDPAGPAGATDDVMYWLAGTSVVVNNQQI